MSVYIRVYHNLDGYTLIVTGAKRRGRETIIPLSLGEAEELGNALLSRLVARIPSDPDEEKGD